MTGGTDKKKKTKVKRRKTLDKSPRVTVLSFEEADQEVECRLELSNRSTITFKFALENDKPEEIAENLVSHVAVHCHAHDGVWFQTAKFQVGSCLNHEYPIIFCECR